MFLLEKDGLARMVSAQAERRESLQRYFERLGNCLDFMCLFGMGGKNPKVSRNIPRLLSMHLDRVVPFTALWLRNSNNIEQLKERDREEQREKEGIKAESQTGRTLVAVSSHDSSSYRLRGRQVWSGEEHDQVCILSYYMVRTNRSKQAITVVPMGRSG